MKRSEMVQLIYNETNKSSYTITERVAERILKIIEQAGMLPPVCSVQVEEDPLRPGTCKHTETKREWEKE